MLAVAGVQLGQRLRAGRGCGGGSVSARSLSTRRPGSMSRSPITARSGWRASGSSTSSRTVSSGSSTATVPVPISIVSHSARSRCVSRRAALLETQRLVPSAAALRPSRVVANFQVTNGRPWSTANVQARFSARARSASRPPSTSTPGVAQRLRLPRRPPGWCRPARTPRGVRPRRSALPRTGPCGRCGCTAPGSRPRSRREPPPLPRAGPPPRRAGEPAPRWKPSAISAPLSSMITQPTRGFGPSGTPGLAARTSARSMARRSARRAPRRWWSSPALLVVRPAGVEGAGRRCGEGERASRTDDRAALACVRFPSGL